MPGVNVVAAANRVFQEFNPTLMKEYEAAPRMWQSIAMQIPSSSRSTLFAWLANQANVREWVGPRQHKGMSTRTWEVIARKFELSFEFSRDQIDDDLSGLVGQAIMAAGSQAQAWIDHENQLIATVLEAGISSLCFDGQFFFDTDHPIDLDGVTSGTFDNDLALALTFANFSTALDTIRGYKRANGMPAISSGGYTLLVPNALALAAHQILNSTTITPGTAFGLAGTGGPSPNPFIGAATLEVNPYLTDTTRWYLLSKGAMKPLMFLMRRPLEVESQGPGSPIYYEEEKIRFGGSARYEASYTLPQLGLTSKP